MLLESCLYNTVVRSRFVYVMFRWGDLVTFAGCEERISTLIKAVCIYSLFFNHYIEVFFKIRYIFQTSLFGSSISPYSKNYHETPEFCAKTH